MVRMRPLRALALIATFTWLAFSVARGDRNAASASQAMPVPIMQEAKTTPPGLLKDLADIDRKLDQLIKDWKRGTLGSNKDSSLHYRFFHRFMDIGHLKLNMVKTYFNAPGFGKVDFYEVFQALDAVDWYLELADGWDLNKDGRKTRVPQYLDEAKKTKERLEDQLHAAASSNHPPPMELLTDLVHLDRDLSNLINDWDDGKVGDSRNGGLHSKFGERIDAISVKKRAIVKKYFDFVTYGSVTSSYVFTKLDCLDGDLFLAWAFDSLPDEERNKVPKFLKLAQECKQALEDMLHQAASTPTPTATPAPPTKPLPTPTPTCSSPGHLSVARFPAQDSGVCPGSKGGCVGSPTKLFDNSNGLGQYSPTPAMPPTFDTDTLGPSGQQYCLVRIWTYHFNFGKGAPPGEVGLKDDSGAFVAGPVAPVGSTGAFNTPNANWDATFPTTQPIVLHGTYSVFDSDPATWFNNDMSKGFGFAQVWVENYLPSNP